MIVDKFENARLYAPLSEKLAKAFEILRVQTLADKPAGRYDVDGDDLYYVVDEYCTRPVEKCRFETHKKYIDVQLMLSGREIVGYCPDDALTTQTPYDEQKDIEFFDVPKQYAEIDFCQGVLCVFWPQDGHMPGCAAEPTNIRKIVVKIRIDNE